MPNIFDTLTDLPPFKGLSHEAMAAVVGKFRCDFRKYDAGAMIVEAGTPCRSLLFILSGSVRVSILLPNGLNVYHTLQAGCSIGTEYLFGRSTCHPASVTAIDSVGTLEISKADYMKILASEQVCLFNFLNFLALKAQSGLENIIDCKGHSPADFIKEVVKVTTDRRSSDITVSAVSGNIPSVIHYSDTDFINSLMLLRDAGIVEFDLRTIKILSRDKLILHK